MTDAVPNIPYEIGDSDNELSNEIKDKFVTWGESTTFHGIPNILRAKEIIWKIIWLACFLTSLGFCSYLIRKTLVQYLNHEVTTIIRTIPQTQVQFPQVSICNENMFISPEASDLIKAYFKDTQNLTINNYQDMLDYLPLNKKTNLLEELLYETLLPTFNASLRKSLGYSAQQTFFKLTFNNLDFNLSEIKQFYDPYYGNCFRINTTLVNQNNASRTLYADRVGYGFKFEIFTGLSDYEHLSSHASQGIRVEIKDDDGYPYMYQGLLLKPGIHTDIKIRKKNTQVLPQPFSDCIDTTGYNSSIFQEMQRHGLAYTRTYCQEIYVQYYYLKNYGCIDYRLVRIIGAQPCNVSMLSKLNVDFARGDKECPLECQSSLYAVSLSNNEYPTNSYIDESLVARPMYFEDVYRESVGNITYTKVRECFTSVFIYFETLAIEQVNEQEMFDTFGLISNLGGTFGLFLGVSILTLVEFIEMVAFLFYTVFKKTVLKYFRQKLSKNK